MTKAIISVPADLSCYKLVSLREILAKAEPSLEYEIQSDATCLSTEVKQFIDPDSHPENRLSNRFRMMSALQSALHKFESVFPRRRKVTSINGLN